MKYPNEKRVNKTIVIGLGINGLTVCRALGHEHISVIGISEIENDVAIFSKYIEKTHVVCDFKRNLISYLMSNVFNDVDGALLFPTTDQTVELITKNNKVLSERYLLPFSKPDLVGELLDKTKFRSIALDKNLKVAKGFLYKRGQPVDFDLIRSFPIIIKTIKKIYKENTSISLPKAVIVENNEDAKIWVGKYLEYANECLVEEYIAGDDGDVFFVFVMCDINGKVVLDYCGKKIRQWPPLTGGTASARPWSNKTLVMRTRKFFEDIEYTGLASMEFKYDKGRNEYFAIEPTVGRIDFQEGLAIGNGCNFPFALYCELFGFQYHPLRKEGGKEWICYDADRNAIEKQSPSLCIGKISWFLSILLMRKIYSVFNINDYRPFLHWLLERIKGKLKFDK